MSVGFRPAPPCCRCRLLRTCLHERSPIRYLATFLPKTRHAKNSGSEAHTESDQDTPSTTLALAIGGSLKHLKRKLKRYTIAACSNPTPARSPNCWWPFRRGPGEPLKTRGTRGDAQPMAEFRWTRGGVSALVSRAQNGGRIVAHAQADPRVILYERRGPYCSRTGSRTHRPRGARPEAW